MGWAGIKNGRLLALMEPIFDVFVTVDGNLTYQQNLQNRQIALIVLSAPDNTFETLSPIIVEVAAALEIITIGQTVEISASE